MEHHHHFDYDRVAEFRSLYVDDSLVMKFVSPDKHDTVLDIGAGDGHFSVLFSGTAKSVYAMDINPVSKRLTEEKAKNSGAKNVVHILQDSCSGELPDKFNIVFFGSSFHDLPCRDGLLERIREKAGGNARIVLLEFKKEETPGPPVEIRISEEELLKIMTGHGFRLRRTEQMKIHYIQEYVMNGE